MNPVQTNKHVFFDDEGNVLRGGSIYIGQPDTDPRTNQKTVTLRDSGGAEFTAEQPLETVAGRIAYNGKPIVALVDGDYSMLVFDSAGQQTDYYRLISAPTDSGGDVDFSEVTRVGLTLSEIKGFDAAVGETIQNVGRLTAEDGEGGEWLVKSATGSAGDDVFLIDLTNGLQATRINKTGSYPKLVWSGSATSVSMDDLDDGGPGVYSVGVSGTFGTLYVSGGAGDFTRGLLDLDIDTGFFVVKAVRYSPATNNFTAIRNAIINISTTPETDNSDLTITQIYKVL